LLLVFAISIILKIVDSVYVSILYFKKLVRLLISSNSLLSITSRISLSFKLFLEIFFFIFLAICLKILVGTASPILCLIFISVFLDIFFLSSILNEFNASKDSSVHLKSLGIVIIFISSLIENTLSSIG